MVSIFLRSKSALCFALLSAVWITANIAWLGCAIVPLPARHDPVMSRTTAEFKSAKKSNLSREEVMAKVGRPDAYLSDLHIACYRVNYINKRGLVLFLLLIPLGTQGETESGKFDLALIEFDQTDHISRYKLVGQDNGESYDHAAKQWLGLLNKPVDSRRR